LAELQDELAAGQKILAELDAKRTETQATMLRIAGAAQVLEELLRAEMETTAPMGNGVQHKASQV
jgi:hypothetical protein